MNIDSPRLNRIRHSDAPVEDMMTELEEFANRIGGPAWRQHRARHVMMKRAISLYLDEDNGELFNPGSYHINNEPDAEMVKVGFKAYRVPSDEPEADYSNRYILTHSHQLPIYELEALPEALREHVAEHAKNTDMTSDKARSRHRRDPLIVNERRKTKYTIDQEDGAIDLRTRIDYIGEDFFIQGEKYKSNKVDSIVHFPEFDGNANEYVSSNKEIQQEQVTDMDEMMRVTLQFHELLEHYCDETILAGQSYEDHAIKVLSLLAVAKSSLRYRPDGFDR